MKEKPVRIVFRRDNTGKLIVLFPDLPGSRTDSSRCVCYDVVGDFGSVDVYSIIHRTSSVDAGEDDAKSLLSTLESIGGKLKVLKKVPSGSALKRHESTNYALAGFVSQPR